METYEQLGMLGTHIIMYVHGGDTLNPMKEEEVTL